VFILICFLNSFCFFLANLYMLLSYFKTVFNSAVWTLNIYGAYKILLQFCVLIYLNWFLWLWSLGLFFLFQLKIFYFSIQCFLTLFFFFYLSNYFFRFLISRCMRIIHFIWKIFNLFRLYQRRWRSLLKFIFKQISYIQVLLSVLSSTFRIWSILHWF
jgi:hypothetical protein